VAEAGDLARQLVLERRHVRIHHDPHQLLEVASVRARQLTRTALLPYVRRATG
jgi:hypothetical protein